MLISKYGFFDVVGPGVGVDPSRIAGVLAVTAGDVDEEAD
jgi:hypothetical protein